MPCCPHCIEYFDEHDDSQPCCGGCGHPLTCPRGCHSFEETGGALVASQDAGSEEDFRSERSYREGAAAEAKTLGLALREADTRLGPEHPRTILARLRLFDLYVDPEWEDFEHYTPEQTRRVADCADRLLRLEPALERGDTDALALASFRLRLARIYLDVHSTAKGEALARRGLGAIRAADRLLNDISRLAWTCYNTRQLLDVAEDSYRRIITHLEGLGRDHLDPLECLQQVLASAGRIEAAHLVSARLRALRVARDAQKREKFSRTLSALRRAWEWQDQRGRLVRG